MSENVSLGDHSILTDAMFWIPYRNSVTEVTKLVFVLYYLLLKHILKVTFSLSLLCGLSMLFPRYPER